MHEDRVPLSLCDRVVATVQALPLTPRERERGQTLFREKSVVDISSLALVVCLPFAAALLVQQLRLLMRVCVLPFLLFFLLS